MIGKVSPLVQSWSPERILKMVHDFYVHPRCGKGVGAAWEPQDPRHPILTRAIQDGYLKRADGRCGFEAMKDSFVAWTPAGLAAMKGYVEPVSKPVVKRDASGLTMKEQSAKIDAAVKQGNKEYRFSDV